MAQQQKKLNILVIWGNDTGVDYVSASNRAGKLKGCRALAKITGPKLGKRRKWI